MASKKAIWLALGLGLVAAPLLAAPMLHEHFEPNPSEDLRLGATTPSGKMPAAIQTKSGVIAAPEEAQSSRPDAGPALYGGPRTQSSADANYYIDRVTTRPESVDYDEPFRPSILPFKRLYAFDKIQEDLAFGVASEELVHVSVGGLADASEDAFFADFEVDLVADVPVRIPSVGPGARIRALHVDPSLRVEVLEDGAENWFARSERGGRVRMVMQLSIERNVFGSQFRPVSWGALKPYLSSLPAQVVPVAAEVAAHIGVRRSDSPAGVLQGLVRYFRQFRASAELPTASGSLELYRELSFSKKGVCRHRAYAFAITALAMGLPTRLVHNEAHAWVEVYDTEIWHRIDLGGASSHINQTRQDPLAPRHRAPNDPHSWPSESRPAASSQRPRTPPSEPRADLNSEKEKPGAPGETSNPAASWPGATASSSEPSTPGTNSTRPGEREAPAEVELMLGQARLLRGHPLPVSGKAQRAGTPCRLARVDIYIAEGDSWTSIGSLATDREGHFNGQVTLPQVTPVGPLRISARVAGGCD